MKIPQRKKQEIVVPFPAPRFICFDIETIPQPESELTRMMPIFEPDSRLKDEAKIAESIAKQKAKFFDRAALDWKTAQVALICIMDNSGDSSSITGTEQQILETFWTLCESALIETKLGGHNVKGFDFPMLVNRSRVLGVKVPANLFTFWNGKTQWNEAIFDTLEILAFGSTQRFEGCGVEDCARVFNLPPKLGSGADFHLLWKSDKQAAVDYCLRDVEIETALARICGV